MKDKTFVGLGMLILGAGGLIDANVRLPVIIALGIITTLLVLVKGD